MARKRSIDGIGVGVVITFRLGPSMITALDIICESSGKSRSIVLRDSLKLYFEMHEVGDGRADR